MSNAKVLQHHMGSSLLNQADLGVSETEAHPAPPPFSIWVMHAEYELADVEHTSCLFSEGTNEQLVFPLEDLEQRVSLSFRCHPVPGLHQCAPLVMESPR